MMTFEGDDSAFWHAAYIRGQTAFPDVPLAEETFVAYVTHATASHRRSLKPPAPLVDDLFLACACVNRVPGAAAAFQQRMSAAIHRAVKWLARDPATEDEIRQELLEDLLVGSPDRPALIGRYRGDGPLAAWVAVAAQRRGVSHLRAEKTEARARLGAAAVSNEALAPDLIYLRQRYHLAFERAIAEATQALGIHARVVLGLCWVRRLGLKEIGALYGVTKSTASRWVIDAQQTLVAETRRLLRQRLGITEEDLAAMAAELTSEIDVSLSGLLQSA
jgi:RNA polymerase sigma-70 factor, ECF subfamily